MYGLFIITNINNKYKTHMQNMRRNCKQQDHDSSSAQMGRQYCYKSGSSNNAYNKNVDHQYDVSSHDQSQKENINNNTPNRYTYHSSNSRVGQNSDANTCMMCQSGYSEIIEEYYACRKENYQLKNTIKQLQMKLTIIEQASKLTQSGNSHSATQYWDRIKYLQEEYIEHKNNTYQHYQKQTSHLQKVVEYLVACYQQSIVTRNNWLADVMDKIRENGTLQTLKDPKLVDQILGIYQGRKRGQPPNKNQSNCKVDPGYCFDGEFGIGQLLDQKQSRILRKRIKQLTLFIDSLIKLYRNELSQLRELATGRSQEIVEEIKSCILRNFGNVQKIKLRKTSAERKEYSSDSYNESQPINIKTSIEKNMKISKSQSKTKQIDQASKAKRISLENSIQIKAKKPPLPSGSSTNKNRKIDQDSSCNYSYMTQYPQRQRRGSIGNPISKNVRTPAKSGTQGGSASKSKRKINKI